MRPLDWPKLFVVAALWAAVTLSNILVMPGRYAVRIKSEVVKEAPLLQVVRAPGNLDAKASVTIKAQFDADVASKHFKEGQRVEEGDLLAVLNRDNIRLDFQARQDALTNARADLAQARKEVKLQKTLYDKQAVAYSA